VQAADPQAWKQTTRAIMSDSLFWLKWALVGI